MENAAWAQFPCLSPPRPRPRGPTQGRRAPTPRVHSSSTRATFHHAAHIDPCLVGPHCQPAWPQLLVSGMYA
jgi:hypothetical protein